MIWLSLTFCLYSENRRRCTYNLAPRTVILRMWRRSSLGPLSFPVPHRVCKVQKPICSQRTSSSVVNKPAPRSGHRDCGWWERVAGREGRPRRYPIQDAAGLYFSGRKRVNELQILRRTRLWSVCVPSFNCLDSYQFSQEKRSKPANAAWFVLPDSISHFSVKKPLHQKESLGSGKGKIRPENDLFLVHTFR